MHETKALLILNNGLRCMLCGKKVPYSNINWHHIKWKSICKYYGQPVDDSYDNGALLCLDCHAYVHQFSYFSKEYAELMKKVCSNKS